MAFDTSQLIPVDNEFSDAAMFIPIESDSTPKPELDVTKTPEYGITQKILGIIPKMSQGLNIAQSGLYAPTAFEEPPTDIMARSNEPWQPQLQALSPQDIQRLGMAGELMKERQESERSMTLPELGKMVSGKVANVGADVLSGAARFLKAPPNLFGGTFKTFTGQEPPAPSPVLPESITGPMENLAGQVKRNVAGELERLPQTTGRIVEENIADIGAGLIPAVVPLGPLFMGLQAAGAPDLESEARALSQSNGISLEQAQQQVLDNAVKNGIITGATWAALPEPLRNLGEKALGAIPARAAAAIGRPGRLAARQALLSGVPLTGTSLAEEAATGKPIELSELPARFGVSSLFPAGGRERAREAVERAKPEPTKIGREEEVSKIVQETLDQARKENPDKTFRQASPEEIAENQGRNIWREKYTGDIVFNPEEVGRTITSKNILTKNLRRFFGKGWVHEVIHDNTVKMFGKDAKTEILNFYNNSTALEKALNQRAYEKQWGKPASTEEQLAHEMFRRRIERLTDMTTTELVQTKGMEWLTQKFIDVVERGLIDI